MKTRLFLAFVALHGACHSEDSKFDRSQALEIQTLDQQVELKVLDAQSYCEGLEEASRALHAAAMSQTLDQYYSCSHSGRKTVQAAAVKACAESFQSDLNGALRTLVDEYRRKHEKSFETLNGEVLALGDRGARIGKDLEEVQQTYKTCQDEALNQGFPENSSRLLRACEMTVEAEMKRIDFSIKTIDVDVLDTF